MTTQNREIAVKSIWCMTADHKEFGKQLQLWKDNMSTAGSKVINARIQWTEELGKLPLIVLGVKGDRIRFAAFGGSDGIAYASKAEWDADVENLVQLACKTNDEVTAWRDSIKVVEPKKVEKVDKPAKVAAGRPAGTTLSGSFNNAGLMGLAQSTMKHAF